MKRYLIANIENKLTEYEMAQNSAEHHDNLVWSVSTLNWGVSSVLLGFVLNNITESSLGIVVLLFCLIGVFLILCSWLFARQFRSIRNQKYKRCKELEKELGLVQHTNIKHKDGSQSKIYSMIMVLFIVTWAVVFIKVIASLLGYAMPMI
ncbi:MAG: LapA family protein [Alcanivorax jadensis]|uniref:LapA family protein n=1 Tax=Alcanivorax jadensis TaxID=64988 RepID=UPI003001DC0C